MVGDEQHVLAEKRLWDQGELVEGVLPYVRARIEEQPVRQDGRCVRPVALKRQPTDEFGDPSRDRLVAPRLQEVLGEEDQVARPLLLVEFVPVHDRAPRIIGAERRRLPRRSDKHIQTVVEILATSPLYSVCSKNLRGPWGDKRPNAV